MYSNSQIETKIQQASIGHSQTLSATQAELLHQLHAAVLNERNSTLLVIELLRKAEQENLYLSLGFGSLKEFCMKEFKYSETAATRRISALRVVQEIPEIEKKIEEGSLSLTVISQAASHIYQKERQQKLKLDISDKKELFEKLENLSLRATEKVLFQDAPEIIQKKEKLRQVSEELQELKMILTAEMQKDLEDLKMLLSHQMPGASLTEVLKFAVKESLKKRRMTKPAPVLREGEGSNDGQDSKVENGSYGEAASCDEVIVPKTGSGPKPKPEPKLKASQIEKLHSSKRIQWPVAIKKAVWGKARGQCCYQFQGRRCASRFQLQIDHILPLARGGTNVLSNLQLLCRAHNQLKGAQT